MLGWKDGEEGESTSTLELVDEFRTFVRPTWKPILSQFCTQLTGISQVGVFYLVS